LYDCCDSERFKCAVYIPLVIVVEPIVLAEC
jgi:hypothetical protein